MPEQTTDTTPDTQSATPTGPPATANVHIADLFKRDGVTASFEFFPPKSAEAADSLYAAIADLEELKPSFVSVTYGAGGSTRELTTDLVLRIQRETPLHPVPHLTGVCHTPAEVDAMLEGYATAGVRNIMALGGDPPHEQGAPMGRRAGEQAFAHFRYGIDVVRAIRAFSDTHLVESRRFGIGVGGYPEGHAATPNRLTEMDHLKAKVDAGADFIITQLFFDNHDYYDFRERCELAGIRVPIVAGIMPITSTKGMARMADLAAGSRFPAPLLRALRRAGDEPDLVRRVGLHWATEQCRDLLDHKVAGLHLYTLNKSKATREIYRTLGVKDSRSLS
ncbi:MAG: methylenetetrahydrofolate reductase [NAD(P)H] [Phycisphaerales bacterium]|nr:methylenetetrahydrofolate reductase [NAD(P)H] [Phycisphaerales bacterium]